MAAASGGHAADSDWGWGVSYRDLRADEIIRPGDQFLIGATLDGWGGWITVYPTHEGWGKRADETGMRWRRPLTGDPEQPTAPASKYHRTITQTIGDDVGREIVVDVYDVLTAFAVTCPAIQHAVKKLLCPGLRGQKSAVQDLREAVVSIERAIQLIGGDGDEHG